MPADLVNIPKDRQRSDGPSTLGVVGGIIEYRDSLDDPNNNSIPVEAGRAVCRALSSSGYTSIPLANRTGPGYVCEPYLDDNGWDPPLESPPFTGGQCSVAYRIRATKKDGSGQGGVLGQYTGPITEIQVIQEPPPNVVGSLVVTTAYNGGQSVSTDSVSVNGSEGGWTAVPVRVDGLPDDCGDPPPTESLPGPNNPGTPFGTPQPVNIGGDDYNITVGGPEFDVDGTVSFPVSIDVGGVQISPDIDFNFNLALPDFGGKRPPPAEPATEGEPTESPDDGGEVDDPAADDEEEEEFETIGYRWDLVGLTANLSAVPRTDPKVLVTPYGNIQLRYRTEGGAVLYSDNVPIKVESGSILRSLDSLKVIGVAYSKRPDVNSIRLTPIRARIGD